ncbi:hypothetical protein EVAR_99740_1 [Eumeta japonica]|uniref:Uncharacterized protein n=1 Tax=Eumeta variegata TaxID=151549 RepID=A0A4C1Z7S5_EUMVA|nr:hypothetical protein EVAR_99740_1 [Eumeta japonica]
MVAIISRSLSNFLFFAPVQKSDSRIKYKLKHADWNGYRDQLDHRFAKLSKLSASDPTSCTDDLSQIMLSVADDMFPLKKHSTVGIPSPPWWDQECKRAVEERRGAEIPYC